MTGQHIGYVRVSSFGQNTGRQLMDIGLTLDRVFEEKRSGADYSRPVLKECLKYLRQGDTLHVHSIDRLARSLKHLDEIVEGLCKRGVSVRFHKEGLEFSGENDTAMNKLLLQLLGAVAEFERSLINERQAEGIAKAKAAGKFAKKKKLSPEQVAEIRTRIAAGESKKSLALEYGVSRQTIYSHCTG